MGLVGDIQVCERNSKTLEQELEKERQFTNEFAFKTFQTDTYPKKVLFGET